MVTGKEKLYVSEGTGRASVSIEEIAQYAAGSIQVGAITTAGGTVIPAGTLQETLQAIADLANPEV